MAAGNQNWSNQGWANQGWGGPPFWHLAGISRPVGIALMILGFMFWWPVGLAVLVYMVGSGRMGCSSRRRGMAQSNDWQNNAPWSGWKSWMGGDRSPSAGPSSGNHAFDEYRKETLRRLEEEQKEFGSFLERLRFAKDKAEFDQFMAERRGRPPASPTEEQPST